MEYNKHIKSFNKHQENLNISDIGSENIWLEKLKKRFTNKLSRKKKGSYDMK